MLSKVLKYGFKSSSVLNKKLSIGESLSVLEPAIKGINQISDPKQYGTVLTIGDGIARVFGLNSV